MKINPSSYPYMPRLQVLSQMDCQTLVEAAFECMERVGVLVNNEQARELLAGAGARLDDRRAFIPPHIIHRTLESTPSQFTLWGRDPEQSLAISPDCVYFGPGPTCTYYLDPDGNERRKARRGDAAITARVVDALPNLDYAMGLSLFDDVTPSLAPVYEFAEMVANTSKPVLAWATSLPALQAIFDIAAAAAGGESSLRQKPLFAYFGTYESPLHHADNMLENMLWAAGKGIPVIYLGGPTVGLESPPTSASGLVLHLAAALSGLAIVQLKHPGAPVVIGGLPSAMDLRTARPAYGSPEGMLNTAAAAELARYLKLPFMGTAGATESKSIDAQAGAEAAFQVLMSGLSRGGLVHDVGFLDCADIGSPQYLVLVDELVGHVKRILRGVEVSHEAIMMELIEKVIPNGSFLKEPQSVRLCRKEIWTPGLFDRSAYVIWERDGSQSIEQRIHTRLEKILNSHQPMPLPEGAQELITQILSQVERVSA